MQIELDGNPVHCGQWPMAARAGAGTVLLLHGALHDHTVWDPIGEALAQRGLHALAPDLPGHGASPGPALDSIESMAAWLNRLLGLLRLPRVLVAGHSMGSLIALEWAGGPAARSPPVTGVVLLGTAAPMRVAPTLLDLARSAPLEAAARIAEWSHPAHMEATSAAIGAGPRALTLALLTRVANHGPADLLARDLHACNNYQGAQAAAARLDCPAWIVRGQHDRMTPPRTSETIAAALSHGKIITLDSGHGMMVEHPEAVTALLRECAAELGYP